MTKLNRLVNRTVIHVQDGQGEHSVRLAIRDVIGDMSLADLARKADVPKSSLDAMVRFRQGRVMHSTRRAVEPVLGLPAGGLAMVIAIIEDLNKEDS